MLEALSYGVPIFGWPLTAEQFYNAKLLVEQVGVWVEIARRINCEAKHEEILTIIELVMNGTEKGRKMKRKASEVKVIRDAMKDKDGFKGSSVKSMEELLNSALVMNEKTKSVPSFTHQELSMG